MSFLGLFWGVLFVLSLFAFFCFVYLNTSNESLSLANRVVMCYHSDVLWHVKKKKKKKLKIFS